MKDKRRTIRVAVHGEISARLVAHDETLELRDLGPGGFLALAATGLAVGTTHQVRFIARNGLTVTVAARCVHCRESHLTAGRRAYLMGFAFVRVDVKPIEQMLDLLTGSITFN
jgi:hypothetical protein